MGKFGQNENIESCLKYDDENGCLVYTTNLGNDKAVKLPSDKVEFGFTGECELVVLVNGIECDRQDITPVLDKYNFNYDSNTHTITAGPEGDEVPFVLNCATLKMNTANGACELVYTNEKKQANTIPLPLLSMTRDADACTVTASDGKGGTFTFYEGANPETDIALELDDNKDLCLRYKTKECHIVLPNFVTDFALDQTNCILKVFRWCDVEPTEINLFAAIGLTKNDDGGFDLQIKDQLCTFSPASLTQNPNNPNKFTFDNKYGQTVTITLPTSNISDNGDGTATIVMADGTNKTNVICGQQGTVTDNGDGTGTVTMNDGTECTFLKTVDFPSDIRITGLSFEESADGGMHSLVATLSDGSTINAGPIVDQFSSVESNGDGTATITTPQGVKNDVVCGVQSTVVGNEDAPGTATITQNDGSQKTDVLCGTPSSVVPNDAETGGGVGTATMTQTDGSVKSDVVCGAQSTVVPSEDGRTAMFTQNDGSTKQVLCAGNDSITQNDEGVGGGVGTSTITLPGGDVKADVVCGQQSTVADNEDNGTFDFTQNDGTTAQVCKSPVKSVVDGGSSLVDNTDPINPVINPLLGCDGTPIDVTDAAEENRFRQVGDGGVHYITGTGANPNNPSFYAADCIPPLNDCPSQGDTTAAEGILWQHRNGAMRPIVATSCPESGLITSATPTLDNDALQALFEASGVGVDVLIESRELCFVNEDCMRQWTQWGYRYIYGGALSGGNYITANIVVDTAVSDIASSAFCGTPNHRADMKCNDVDCVTEFSGPPLWGHTPGWGNLAGPRGSGNEEVCVKVDFSLRFAEPYLPNPLNIITNSTFCLFYQTTRDTRSICAA